MIPFLLIPLAAYRITAAAISFLVLQGGKLLFQSAAIIFRVQVSKVNGHLAPGRGGEAGQTDPVNSKAVALKF
jgi:hypothetical protein